MYLRRHHGVHDGCPNPPGIAKELSDVIRKNVTIDWTERETARAKLRTLVKRLLRKHGTRPTSKRR
ncbi:MAG: type I restriction enzyme endonuclease domain-containing protein [Myxococcaceae bacterium]